MHLWILLLCVFEGSSLANGKSTSRIVGGDVATKRYPYQVSIDSPAGLFGNFVYLWRHFCGGSIITDRHILTAAHCITSTTGVKRETKALSILVGTNDWNKGGTRYSVCATVYHEKYIEARFNFDIAIITVSSAITMKPGEIETISYSTDYTGAGVRCIITGWGSNTTYTGGSVPNLKEVEVTTLSDDDCKAAFETMDEHNICTKSDGEGQGFCSGDSGGPVADKERGILVAVVNSVNGGICGTGKPDFNARVSTFDQWIREKTNSNEEQCTNTNNNFLFDSLNLLTPMILKAH